MKKTILLTALLATLTGCASRPESIQPSFMSSDRFIVNNCSVLGKRLATKKSELDKFSLLQNQKADGDAIGVFLLGVPFSKLSGDHQAKISTLKGEVQAIETAQIKKRCAK